MMANERATLADVGRLAGVSSCTASMALRNNPRVAKATRERILAAAKTLDYRPDPALAALVARRKKGGSPHVFANIAAIVDERWPHIESNNWIRLILDGMLSACKRFGYQLDVLHCTRDLLSAQDPNRILLSRGIRGVVILPTVDERFALPLDWDYYAAVSIGTTLPLSAQTHRVGTDHYSCMHLACRKMANLGYRRVGLVNPLQHEIRIRFENVGALSKERFVPEATLQPTHPHLPSQLQKQDFLRWFRKEKPEGIITDHWSVIDWLRDSGYEIPRQVGVSILSYDTCPYRNVSGISQHLDHSGECAIDLIHTQLLRGETGLPMLPRELLVQPQWIEGGTTCPH